jgi:streptogramin lyase
MPKSGIQHSEQNMQNHSFDNDFGVFMTESVGYDGQNLQRMNASNQQIYSVSDGGYTYFCFAAPGTALATAKWKIFRLDSDANLLYADHDAEYDNVATDPTLLTYDYS